MSNLCVQITGSSALLTFAAMLILSTYACGQETETRIQNLNSAVAELVKAYDEKNLSKITDLFNSEDVKSIGGHERFVEWVDIGGSASNATLAKFGSPDRVDEVKGNWFGIVPFHMETRKARMIKTVETCLVGISKDDGQSWSFKTCESLFRDYPELLGQIQIIDRTENEIADK